MDVQKRNELVTANLDLPEHVYWDLVHDGLFALTKLGKEDAIGYGNIGLVIAADKWKSDGGATFRTYAEYWVAYYMRHAARYILPMIGFTPKHPPMKRVRGQAGGLDYYAANQERVGAVYENKEEVATLLRCLPKKYADVLDLLYVQGLETKEVAQKLQVSRQRVEQIEQRALVRLRKEEGLCRKAS